MVDNGEREVGQFSIRVRQGYWEVEVSAPDKDFVLTESARLIDQYSQKVEMTSQLEEEIAAETVNGSKPPNQYRAMKPESLTEFFGQFTFQSNLEKILVLAYWCEIRQGQTSFTSDDILAKFKEVREQSPAYIERDMRSLIKKKFLLDNGKSENKSAYALTNTGIKEVESKISQSKAG